ncbi:hypothetical protein HXW73_05150 [Halomonas sp. SH5A2]|uniref:hypothetical protein n=1 Tax=Halomonas sp. SH5A2 TaxID=2749040 RepID=UPI001640207C|nr:hypothetical protein [Halomonas sp. SH5A2]QNI02365.1 hypothetical protein HXW73_05150 [Halomonas sp. SH5A2]
MPYINTFERHGIEKGLLQGREEGRQEGRQEGRLAEKRETALKLINLGALTDLQIADITGLSERDVEALRSDNHH